MTRPDGLEFKTLAVANPVTAVGPAEPDAQGVIEALVAVTGVKDEVGDIIEPGAFRRTLGERPRPKVCLGHDWNRPVGRTLEIVELLPGDRRLPKRTADGRPWPKEAGALRARWQANLDSDDGKAAYSNAKFFGPEESTFSIGYRTTRARQRGSVRHIHDLDLFEYGPVLNPANRLATLQSIKSDSELTNPVDSERQDFETGNDAVETKVKYVRDADYWGKPVGTPITPGMKPRGGGDRERGTTDTKPSVRSFFDSLPSDEQAVVRALPTEQRTKYLQVRAAGKNHSEAMAATGRTVNEQAEDEKYRRAAEGPSQASESDTEPPARQDVPDEVQRRIDEARRDGRDDQAAKIYAEHIRSKKPAPKPRKQALKKPTAKQKALLFAARPGQIMTYRRDDSGHKIYAGPFPSKRGLIFQGHANSAYPMEKAGWVEAGYDGRSYILTSAGERLRVQLESEDSERQEQLRTERREAALGPEVAAPADANVDANAAPMDMTPQQYRDRQMAAQARRNRARNIAAEEAEAAKEADQRGAAHAAVTLAPGAIDLDALKRFRAAMGQQVERRANVELAGGGRVALVGVGTKNWSIVTADNLSIARSIDFEELTGPGVKPFGKRQLRDLANRLTGIRDAEGNPAPFDYPRPPGETGTPEWVRGWRDVTGADLQSEIADVLDQWGQDNDLTYRRRSGPRKRAHTVPGGVADSTGFRMRKAEELAPGDTVRLPDGTTGVVERSGADTWMLDPQDAREIDGQVLLDDGRKISVYQLGGVEVSEPPKPGTGPRALEDAHVARRRGAYTGPQARDVLVPIKFAEDTDAPDVGHDPGMGSMPATEPPPGRVIDFSQLVYSNYVPSIAKTYEPLPAGSRVVQNEQDADSFLPRDGRAKVGTALPLIADVNGETFQTVRLDDGSYDQWRVRGVRGALGSEGAFEIDPSPERIDQIRAERGLPPVGESTPLRRDAVEPEPESIPAADRPLTDLTDAELDVELRAAREASWKLRTRRNRARQAGRNPREDDVTRRIEDRLTAVETEQRRRNEDRNPPATPPKLTAPEPPPEREALPYEVIKKPNRSGKGARVRYNGREYSVDATSGVLAEVTVTDDDGHSSTVSGGSSTLLRRDQFADRERALRQALTQAEAQHDAAETARSPEVVESPESEAEPADTLPTPETTEIPVDQVDEAAALQGEVLGITEQPDGTIEVAEEVAARQDRVAALIEQDDNGTLNLSDRSEPELASTRAELSDELKLQSVLATRQATPKPTILKSPAGAAEKPPQRPGLAGAAEDYSEALQSGDTAAIARTRTRLESSLRRSRAGSESARALADHITGEDDDDAEQLTAFAQRMRREAREKRNAAARRRRTARRLERVRIQSLIDKIDAELSTRARSTEPQGQPASVSADVAGRADTLAANFEEMHGTDGAREMVERLRARKKLSAGDQALLIALEARLTSQRPTEASPLSDDEYAAHTQRVEAALNAAFAAGQATDRVYTANGGGVVWLPDRAAQHKEIIDALWSKAQNVPREGRAMIAGGLGGAGKSTVLRGGAGVDQSQFLTINPDDVKEEMVRRGLVPDVAGLSPMEASPIVHEESSHLANMLARRAYAERVNVIWDITMSRRASVEKRITELRDAGYGEVDAVFVDIPVETSVERALSRHRRGMEKFRTGQGVGGRYVPPALIRANASATSSSANREVFDGLQERFDSWVVFDNSVAGRDSQRVDGAGRWAELTSQVDSVNVESMSEEWTGKNWRQALRDLPVEQRRQIQDAVGVHRYKVYADERAKGADHDAALRVATGEDESGPSLYAGSRSLERVAAELDGINPAIRSSDVFNELAYRKQRLATGRKPLAFENVDSESYRQRIADLEVPVAILTALVEQERAHTQTGRGSDLAFTDNPVKMSPARLRAQMFALERSRNALDQKRLAQLRRAAAKRGITPIAGQLNREAS
jgi:hypothetical protein